LTSILEINFSGSFKDQFFGNLKKLPIMSSRNPFLYRIDMWSIDRAKVLEHLAGADDFQVAMATYRAACERWPGIPSP
jgi:hypothetical protein